MIHTRLRDALHIDHPVISAPMAGTATADLAAAVSSAGGLGLIGASDSAGDPERPEWLRDQIRIVRSRTDRPFGVGFILSFPGTDDLVRVALEERVAAVALSFGDPALYARIVRESGAKLLVQIQTVAQARRAVAVGADVIAAQGVEAGGHTGANGSLSFIPAVVDVADEVPVVAAGGIADGRGLAAALMLGADGVWMGTRFVASYEWAGDDWRKAHVVAAGADDTIRTLAYDLGHGLTFPEGIGGRVLSNAFTDAWHGRDVEVLANQDEIRRQLQAASDAGDAEMAAVWAGNAVGLIHGVESATDIVRRVVAEAERLLRVRTATILR